MYWLELAAQVLVGYILWQLHWNCATMTLKCRYTVIHTENNLVSLSLINRDNYEY